MGYSLIGPNSLYRLTIPEINMLQRGYAIRHRQEEKEDSRAGVPRNSDYAKLRAFKKEHQLT